MQKMNTEKSKKIRKRLQKDFLSERMSVNDNDSDKKSNNKFNHRSLDLSIFSFKNDKKQENSSFYFENSSVSAKESKCFIQNENIFFDPNILTLKTKNQNLKKELDEFRQTCTNDNNLERVDYNMINYVSHQIETISFLKNEKKRISLMIKKIKKKLEEN